MLFAKLTKVEDDWLWHNGRIGSMPEVGFGCFRRLVVEERIGWRILLVMQSLLHGVVDFIGSGLL
jgi:hypothetical protein